MKKTLKITIVCIIAIICALSVCFSVAADTYYTYYGYEYTIYNELSISLTGWDNRTPELVVPNAIEKRNVISIANSAFENNTEITSVSFDGVKYLNRIGSYAFYGCTEIASPIILPNSITVINDSAFMKCSSIPKVQISKGVKSIPQQCFYNCSSLKIVKLFEGLESIDRIAFMNCTSLEYLEIPKSVSFIYNNAFKNDDNLVLGVYKDTYALQYAEDNKIDHIILDGDKIGDVNGDGVVDILDATEIQKYAAESTVFTPEQFELGDINKDGYCDVIDALLVQKSVIGAYELPQNIIRY